MAEVSIPQAVSAVATLELMEEHLDLSSFNTASGKCCCNLILKLALNYFGLRVSIPQAVSAVATTMRNQKQNKKPQVSIPQAVSAVATY